MTPKLATLLFSETEEKERPLLEEALNKHGGEFLKKIGSLCICSFQKVEDAANAALDYRKALENPNHCRMALAEGLFEIHGQDVTGEAANLAAKLHGICGPGSILADEKASRSLETTPIALNPLGRQAVPGVAEEIELFSVGAGSGALDLTDLSFSNQAPPLTPLDQGKSKEFFDFSRVEQEKMQESAELRSIIHTSTDSDASLALEEDRMIDPTNPEVRRPVKKELPLPSAWKTKAEQKRKLKRSRKKIAWLSLLVFSLTLPLLITSSWWLFFRGQEVEAAKLQAGLQKGLKRSDILKSLAERKTRKGPQNVQNIPVIPKGFGVLTIRSDPSGAQVYINGQKVPGDTPVRIKKVTAGINLKIRVTKPGFEEALQFTNLATDEERKIRVKLLKK